MSNRKLKSMNELFGESIVDEPIQETTNVISTSENIVVELPIGQCRPYHNHKFRVKRGDYDEFLKSIAAYGVISPILVRPYQGEYEIIAGHQRHMASLESGKTTVPAIIRELSDNEAWLIVSETNLHQSSLHDLSISERAEVLHDYHAAVKSQGKRTDIIDEVKKLLEASDNQGLETSRPMGEKLEADEKTGATFDLSARNISRYVRIYQLSKEIKNLVDYGAIPFQAGVELSYLSEENQINLAYILCNSNYKVGLKESKVMRQYEKKKKLSEETIQEILTGKIKEKKKSNKIGFKPMPLIYKKYFIESEYSPKDIETVIDKALALYYEKLNKEEMV